MRKKFTVGLAICVIGSILTTIHYMRKFITYPLGSEYDKRTMKVLCPNGVRESTEDLICKKPVLFEKEYKNPCWSSESVKLRCLPYFLLIGMSKCGTTDMFQSIANHPDVQPPTLINGTLVKETHFFDYRHFGVNPREMLARMMTGNNQSRRTNGGFVKFEDYVDYFDKIASRISSGETSIITGEATPGYLWRLYYWKYYPLNVNRTIPLVYLPHLIHRILPNVKIIITLRNPIDRAQSSYFFRHRHPKNPTEEFDSAMRKSLQPIEACISAKTTFGCLLDEEFMFHKKEVHHIMAGLYFFYLNEWFKVFPSNQFFIVRFEDYRTRKAEILNKIFEFLDIRTLSEDKMIAYGIVRNSIANKGIFESNFTMKESTRELLHNFYKTYNNHLLRLLKNDIFKWTSI